MLRHIGKEAEEEGLEEDGIQHKGKTTIESTATVTHKGTLSHQVLKWSRVFCRTDQIEGNKKLGQCKMRFVQLLVIFVLKREQFASYISRSLKCRQPDFCSSNKNSRSLVTKVVRSHSIPINYSQQV